MGRSFAGIITGAAAVLLFALPGIAAPPKVAVTGSENLIQTVEDTNKTYAFFHALGLEIADRDVLGRAQTQGQVPALAPSSESLDKLCDIPHTTWRYLALAVPNAFNMELIEFAVPNRTMVRSRSQDPGATTLVLMVRNIDAALQAARKNGASVVTAGGAPLVIGPGKTRSVLVRDPDGLFIELVQPDPLPETRAPANGNIIGGSLKRTVQESEKTLDFYRDIFGFEVQPAASFASNKIIAELVAVPAKAQFRQYRAGIPGSSAQWEFTQFKDAPGKPFHAKISDPGASGFQLKVRDVDAAVKAVKAGGGTILTAGGEPLKIGNNRTILVHDPDGFLLELMQNVAQ